MEKLGFRLVKLRHHRGPVFIFPYVQLGALENMSRDWVTDKMTINVTYDTDISGEEGHQAGQKGASEDPELAPNIIKPLNMQAWSSSATSPSRFA